MTGVQLNSRRAVPCGVLCAIFLGASPTPMSAAANPVGTSVPDGCGPGPSWTEHPRLPLEGPLGSCFSSDPPIQAEARLTVANHRPYAQLITVSGAQLDLTESSFASSLERGLARLLATSGVGSGQTALLIGPGKRAALEIDRPPPGEGRVVHISPAPDNAFGVGALAWELLTAAARQLALPGETKSCIASAVSGGVSSPSRPQRALRRIHACVDSSGLPPRAERLLRRLAGRLLRGPSFRNVVRREGSEAHPGRIEFTVPASNPYLVNPAIHLGPANLGTLPGGRQIVTHLNATGGVPPYRFYIVPERGGPEVPPWLVLAADGTVTIEPPAGAPVGVNLPVEVVDSNGEHSVVPY
jgi:hypothetical protein